MYFSLCIHFCNLCLGEMLRSRCTSHLEWPSLWPRVVHKLTVNRLVTCVWLFRGVFQIGNTLAFAVMVAVTHVLGLVQALLVNFGV